MATKAPYFINQLNKLHALRGVRVKPQFFYLSFPASVSIAAINIANKKVQSRGVDPQGFTHIPHGAFKAIADNSSGKCGVFASVFSIDVLNDFLSALMLDRKSTRLNSSHVAISYAVFC